MGEITVFISYSQDGEAHRARVLGLSERLRQDGVETLLDQYVNATPDEGWARWMLNSLNDASRVLCVCTETYYRRFLGREVPGKGHGADWEGALITQSLYDARSRTNRFIPVLFDPADTAFIPEPLRGRSYHVMTSEAGYRSLYDDILEQSGIEPGTVGELKRQPRPTATPLTFDAPPSPAVAIWKEKLEFLLVEEAITVDPAMKFRLKYLIAEAQEKIRALGGSA
ncbi:MAG: toll/interleukin-1 receptor domain-containing protein [Fimbriimonas sp.]